MKAINAVSIAHMIEAYTEKDEKKFFAYASFVADAFDEAGEKRSAKIIRSRIDGSYKNQPCVVSNSTES